MKTLENHLATLLAHFSFVSTTDIQDLTDLLNDSTDERIQKRLKYQPPVKLELTERRHRGELVRLNDTFSVAFEKRCLLLCFNQNPVVSQHDARKLNRLGVSAKALDRDETLFLMPTRTGSMLIRSGLVDKTNRTDVDAWELVPSK